MTIPHPNYRITSCESRNRPCDLGRWGAGVAGAVVYWASGRRRRAPCHGLLSRIPWLSRIPCIKTRLRRPSKAVGPITAVRLEGQPWQKSALQHGSTRDYSTIVHCCCCYYHYDYRVLTKSAVSGGSVRKVWQHACKDRSGAHRRLLGILGAARGR